MVDDTTSMPERPLTFSDAIVTTSFLLSLTLKVLVALLKGWWSGGATASSTVMLHANVRNDIGKDELLLRTQNAVVTVSYERVT